MQKKIVLFSSLAFLLTALVFTGCGKSSAVKPDQGQPAQEAKNMALYKGQDRKDLLLKGAQAERELFIYEAMSKEDLQPIMEKFKEKYPFINIQVYRGSANEARQRLLTEYKAGKSVADVFGSATVDLEIARREQTLQKFSSPEADAYPEIFKNKDRYWVTYRTQMPVLGYNTKLVSKDEAPKTYEDLLDPKWKGKIAVDSEEHEWMATLVKYWGEQKGMDFFNKLSQQDLIIRTGRTLHAQLLSAGEFPISLSTLNHRLEELKQQGAPVDYIALEPAVARPSAISLPAKSNHLNTALLWIDFILSEEGQKIFQGQKRIPVHPKVPADPPRMNTGFKYIMRDDAAVIDEYDKWTSLFQNLFVNRSSNRK